MLVFFTSQSRSRYCGAGSSSEWYRQSKGRLKGYFATEKDRQIAFVRRSRDKAFILAAKFYFFNATVGFLNRIRDGICLFEQQHTVTSNIGFCYALVTRLNQFLQHTHICINILVSMQYAPVTWQSLSTCIQIEGKINWMWC